MAGAFGDRRDFWRGQPSVRRVVGCAWLTVAVRAVEPFTIPGVQLDCGGDPRWNALSVSFRLGFVRAGLPSGKNQTDGTQCRHSLDQSV